MYFDQIEAQHVAKRRRPSPLRNTKAQASGDTVFDQKIQPRPRYPGSRKWNPFRTVSFDYKINFGKPKTTETRDTLNQEVFRRKPSYRSGPDKKPGISISGSRLKLLAIVCGLLVISVIGPNWDGIATLFASQGVSPESLQDSGTPLVNNAGLERIEPGRVHFGGASETPAEVTENNTIQDSGVSSGVPKEEIPLNLTKLFTSIEHTVSSGENISKLAHDYSVTAGSIIALNNLKDASVIRDGRKIKIPNMDGIPYTVRKNDTIAKIAENQKIPENAILDANDLRSDVIHPGQVLFLPGARMNSNEYLTALRRPAAEKPMIKPVSGRWYITSDYGWRVDPVYPKSGVTRFHEGVDIRGAWGSPVKSVMNGVVEEIGYNRVLGNFIIIEHSGYRSLYAHLSSISIKKGEIVKQEQEIGKVGNSGEYTTGAHLHFAVYDKNGKSVNPSGLLK